MRERVHFLRCQLWLRIHPFHMSSGTNSSWLTIKLSLLNTKRILAANESIDDYLRMTVDSESHFEEDHTILVQCFCSCFYRSHAPFAPILF